MPGRIAVDVEVYFEVIPIVSIEFCGERVRIELGPSLNSRRFAPRLSPRHAKVLNNKVLSDGRIKNVMNKNQPNTVLLSLTLPIRFRWW